MFVECAHRYRFYPTAEQAQFLSRTFGCARFVYNRARAERETAWVERKERCGYAETSALLTTWKKDPAMSWLNEVSSVPLQQALRHLDSAYRNFFQRRADYPGFRSKIGPQSAEFTKSGFTWRGGKLKLAKMAEPLAVVWSRDLPSAPTSVTVTREPDGRWFVSCRVQAHVSMPAAEGAIGIDVGIKSFAAISTGETIDNPRHLAKRQKRLAREQRKLSRKKKGSRNRAKSRIRVARCHTDIRNGRRDFLHQLSTRLVRENQTICVETLSVAGMLKSKRMSRSIADAAWGEFFRMLNYKCVWYERRLVKIDRFYPSTKTCSCCGSTGHVLSLADREWTCPDCGAIHDRDHNASLNIVAAGLAVIACGEGVRPGALRHSGQSSVKQELAS